MSLELALKENTETMQKLIDVWNKLTINAGTIVDTRQPTDALAAGGVVIQPPATTAAPAKTETKKSAAVSTQSETAAAPSASKPEESKSAPVQTVTYDDVKALVLQVSKDKGRDAAAAVLSGFGVAKAPELKPEQYADAVAQLKAALA